MNTTINDRSALILKGIEAAKMSKEGFSDSHLAGEIINNDRDDNPPTGNLAEFCRYRSRREFFAERVDNHITRAIAGREPFGFEYSIHGLSFDSPRLEQNESGGYEFRVTLRLETADEPGTTIEIDEHGARIADEPEPIQPFLWGEPWREPYALTILRAIATDRELQDYLHDICLGLHDITDDIRTFLGRLLIRGEYIDSLYHEARRRGWGINRDDIYSYAEELLCETQK